MQARATTQRRIGRYEIDAEIGHGGMATVYRAHDTVLERHVALKVLHPHLRGAPEARARFEREAKTVARLRHPNVLDVYDFGEEATQEAYIAAELLTGPTLKEWIQSQPRLGAELAVALAIQIGEGLAAAHDAGIVHRDVKPENVLLHERRVLKLTDFGIAHLVDAHTFTATGQVIGSPGHMAPEIVQGGEACVATDVFSFGTVLYFLLTGTLPFTGKNPHQLLFRVLEVDFVDPLRIEPAMGAELREIVVSTMAKSPDERPQSMPLLIAKLRAFLLARGFDDVDALAREALSDPAAATARLRPLVVRAEIALGESCDRARDTMGALAHYDRALALEPGHPEVLERVRHAGQGEHAPRLRVIGAVLGLLGVVSLAAAFFGSRGAAVAPSRAPDVRPDVTLSSLPPSRFVVARAPLSPTTSNPSHATTAPVREPSPAAGRPPSSEPRAAAATPRAVTFRPDPQNVSIAIDGAAPREFGPSFRGTNLSPGTHQIRIVPGTQCCETSTFTLEVTPGASPLIVARRLVFRPARVYVVSGPAADVSVALGGQTVAHGRTRQLIAVPMDSLDARAQIVVTAEGYRGYTDEVRLRAGEVAQAAASLTPADP